MRNDFEREYCILICGLGVWSLGLVIAGVQKMGLASGERTRDALELEHIVF
jgi:hypothetical protein